jgi:hypothetical protein
VTNFYTDCLTNGSCVATDVSTAACFQCLFSQPTDSKWGVVIQYDDASFALNLGGCYALIGATSACAVAEQEETECEVAACVGSCSSGTSTTEDTCITSADSGECSTYVSAVAAACTTAITGAATCGGTATTWEDYYTAMAATFCE